MLKIIKYLSKTKGIKIPRKTYYQSKKNLGEKDVIIRFKFKNK